MNALFRMELNYFVPFISSAVFILLSNNFWKIEVLIQYFAFISLDLVDFQFFSSFWMIKILISDYFVFECIFSLAVILSINNETQHKFWKVSIYLLKIAIFYKFILVDPFIFNLSILIISFVGIMISELQLEIVKLKDSLAAKHAFVSYTLHEIRYIYIFKYNLYTVICF